MAQESYSITDENAITNGHGNFASDEEKQSLRKNSGGRSTHANSYKWKLSTIVLSVLLVISFAVIIYQFGKPQPAPTASSTMDAPLNPLNDSPCPQTWIPHEGRCYFYSDAEQTWDASQINCSSQGGSLVAMDTPQEREFILHSQPPIYFWLGFRREGIGEPWKHTNGSLFDNSFTIAGDGLCAYMNEKTPMSTSCDSNTRHWICTKPEEPF